MKAIAALCLVLGVLAGCARHTANEPSAMPGITNMQDCDRAGGTWSSTTGTCTRR